MTLLINLSVFCHNFLIRFKCEKESRTHASRRYRSWDWDLLTACCFAAIGLGDMVDGSLSVVDINDKTSSNLLFTFAYTSWTITWLVKNPIQNLSFFLCTVSCFYNNKTIRYSLFFACITCNFVFLFCTGIYFMWISHYFLTF